MTWNDPFDKEKDEMIKKVADTIYNFDMDLIAARALVIANTRKTSITT